MYARAADWRVGHLSTHEREYPKRVYVVRWGSVRFGEYDHPYGEGEKGVDDGWWTRDSEEYELAVRRMQCTWCSTRDLGQLLRKVVADESVDYGVFFGVSDNDRSWFDVDHARDVLGYAPRDSAEDWNGPPQR